MEQLLEGRSGPNTANPLIRGGDLSTLSALEAAGKSFSDGAGTRPAEQILADHGWNFVRLRLWVDPPNEFNGLPEAAQGAAPDIVQIGNEVTAGLLWPHGQIYRDGRERWAACATLLKAGIAGAREAGLPGRGPAIMIHIDRGGDPPGAQRFYDQILAQDVGFDWIGLSYYPFWHGTLHDLRQTLDTLATRYGKPIAVVETAYPWTLDDQDGYPNIVGPATPLPPAYPPHPGRPDLLCPRSTGADRANTAGPGARPRVLGAGLDSRRGLATRRGKQLGQSDRVRPPGARAGVD